MLSEHIQSVVIGSGVVGLATARKLARNGHEVLVLEAEDSGFHHTSARNSQVIHAGIHYAPGSLKAKLSVKGGEMLYDYCATRHIDHIRCGKLTIAARPDQLAALDKLRLCGERNGVKGMRIISAEEAKELEPELDCFSALLSPSTGTLDVPTFMNTMLGDAESEGAVFAYNAPLKAVEIHGSDFHLDVGGAHPMRVSCRNLINAAGLGAWDVARATKGYTQASIPHQTFAKACYFSLKTGNSPFEHLIYPMPEAGSLGVHSLRDVSGQVRFGPSLKYLDDLKIDYRHDSSASPFENAIRKFWPNLPKDGLQPDTTGIRPRISRPGEPLSDFQIDGPGQHGIPGLVHLFGIESPGLTSSMAIGDYVSDLINQRV
ncbi:MAG: NAD(P)/FAD-dependent oxidoreductase [Pseudoruegeria sp.]